MEFTFFLGIDVGKATFTYCLRNQAGVLDQGEVENTLRAITNWVSSLKKTHKRNLEQFILCMEYTGIYNSILLRVLQQKGLRVCMEGASNIKLSLGMQRGKNDKVDAQRIAEYSLRFTDRLKEWSPRREVVEKLGHLMSSRARLVNARKTLCVPNHEAELFLDKRISRELHHHVAGALKAIDKNINLIESEMKEVIENDENLKLLMALSTSVPGIGFITGCTLIVKTNEYKSFDSAKKIACTAGIAPFEHTSGSSIKGKTRVSHRAHKDLKTALHLAAMGAVRSKGVIQDFYIRKVAEGKNKMLVLNAVRNKLVHLVFAVIRDNTMYQKNYQYGNV